MDELNKSNVCLILILAIYLSGFCNAAIDKSCYCRNRRVWLQWRGLVQNLMAGCEDPILNVNMYVFPAINFCIFKPFFFCSVSIIFCHSFNRRMLMHWWIAFQKTLDSVKGNLLQHLPYINVFSTGNLLKQKGPVCLIVLFRWLVLQLR